MNYYNKKRAGKYISLLTAGLILLSSTSCGMIEMRDSGAETEQEETTALMLAPAERKNTVEARVETETEAVPAPEPAKIVDLVFTGDLRIDRSIVDDAAARATDGNGYSFIRMYTGVFRIVDEADIAMAPYSSADALFGTDGSDKTPVECLAVLSEVGYDILDTSDADNDANLLAEYEIIDIDNSESNAVQLVEREDLIFAYVSTGSDAVADVENVEYADFMSDIVIVSADWGENATDEDKKEIAADLAEAGADIIVGNGDTIGAIEWVTAGDGTKTLVAYSLGNLLATSDNPEELCGGILEVKVTSQNGVIEIGGIVLDSSVVRYTEGGTGYQLVLLKDYGEELSTDHAVSGATYDALISYVRSNVAAEFLAPELRG